MRSILLHRINPARNEYRFYLLSAGPSLLDECAVTRMWGRIGGRQRGMVTPCNSAETADKLFNRLLKLRLRRGYQIINGDTESK